MTGKDALARVGVGHRGDLRQALPIPQPLIVKEEECFVFPDWSAQTASELVPVEGRQLRAVVKSPGIERVVAQIFEQRTVKIVRPGLGDGVDSGARTAELSAISIRLSGKLGDRFHAQSRSQHG